MCIRDSYKKPLMKVLKNSEDQFTSRGFAEGLLTLGQISRTLEKKADVRRFLLAYVNHPKSTVQSGAIRALGELGDPRATAAIESFTTSQESRVASAAKSAVGTLRKEKPMAPDEVVSLRKDLADVKKANDAFKKQLEDIKGQVEALKSAEKKADKAEKGEKKTVKQDQSKE